MCIEKKILEYLNNIPESAQAELLNFAEFLESKVRYGNFPIFIDYPPNPVPRYGFGKPPHRLLYDLINKNRARYSKIISELKNYGSGFATISMEQPMEPAEPYWHNGFVEELDPATLYSFPCMYKSKTYIEIGSGHSTKFVRKAIKEYALETKIISIDPHPRSEIDAICDEVIRQPLECVDLSIFNELSNGDILMIDNSHRCFQNSDVTVVFLELLPRLKPGVMIYIDDIFLPYDYPPEWKFRYYSEQYLLATLLLSDSGRYEIFFPCSFINHDDELRGHVRDFWEEIGLRDIRGCGNSFWIRVAQT